MQRRVLVSMLAVVAGAGLMMAQAQPAPKDAPKPDTQKTTPTKVAPVQKDGDKPKDKDRAKAEPTLKKGSDAPAIQMTEWVKGSPVTGFEKGKVYVVEFWATWCPPCIKSIPHLTELQKKHKDKLTIIGVAGSEKPAGKDGDKRLPTVRDFVKKQGDKMDYTVGFDADKKMVNTWMKPAGEGGIPCSFIVGADGKIAWIGNPLDPKFDGEIDTAIKAAETGKKS